MKRFIEEQEAEKVILESRIYGSKREEFKFFNSGLEVAANKLKNIASANYIDVTRCLECSCYNFADTKIPEEKWWTCNYFNKEMLPSDYCSRGSKGDDK